MRVFSIGAIALMFVVAGCDNNSQAPSEPESAANDAASDSMPAEAPAEETPATSLVSYSEDREQCLDQNANRNAYFGDLHIHTTYSFDGWAAGVRATPPEAYQFAKGEKIGIPPYDEEGAPTRYVQLDRPLDFTAITDHAEFLGEMAMCTAEGSPSYDSDRCVAFRKGGTEAFLMIGLLLSPEEGPAARYTDICGEDGSLCRTGAETFWRRIIDAAESAYDRTSDCSFTALIGYEHTGTPGTSNFHRNVIFRNDKVPSYATSYIDAPKDYQLWEALDRDCVSGLEGCDVLAIPHNSNLSNGRMFNPNIDRPDTIEGEQARAEARNITEPVIEIFQHKGNSECINGLAGILGAPDELCEFEQVRVIGSNPMLELLDPTTDPPSIQKIDVPVTDCEDGTGTYGMVNGGCVSSNDFVRGILLTGMKEETRLGINPYKYGIIASTDSHMASPGAVSEAKWEGHVFSELSLEARLGGGILPSNLAGNPGGLAGVWAIENSRDAIFDALERREVFGTSGPRIEPRFFGGWGYEGDICSKPTLVEDGYAGGVPMGGDLPTQTSEGTGPRFIATATRDPSDKAKKLSRLQIIKGWIDADGQSNNKVYDVMGDAEAGTIDPDTGLATSDKEGVDAMCTVFTDPDFDPAVPAYYYMRVVETPSLRWNQAQCLALAPDQRPKECLNGAPKVIHEMAWTSPIWYKPQGG